MSLCLYEPHCYPVTAGNVTLYLSTCRISQNRTVRTAGTADGAGILTATHPGCLHLTLSGAVSPDADTDAAAAALSAMLLSGEPMTITAGNLVFSRARLTGFSLEQGQQEPSAELTFCTLTAPVLKEDAHG